MDQMMNNQMVQAMMSDPEIMQMMQTPGMLERLQGVMANPQSAMGDPDVMRIVSKLQGLNMAGGGGGGGAGGMGGMGGGGGYGGASPSPAAGSASNIQHLTTSAQLASVLQSAGEKLVVIDYFTSWCGPCKAIAPLFAELAATYKDKVVFVKVDGDQARALCEQQGVRGFPTFEFYVGGQKIESFSGADSNKLRQIVEEYGNAEPRAPVCPYKHFPLREQELVKYAEIKWDLVQPKFREIQAKMPKDAPGALTDADLAAVDKLIATVQDKASYHSSNVGPAEFAALNKLVQQWPTEHQGPVVNLVRMAVFHPVVAKYYAEESNKKGTNDLLPVLLRLAHSSEKHIVPLLVVRTLVNAFSRRSLGKALVARYEDLLESLAGLYKKFADDNFRLSIIALYINLAIFFSEDPRQFEQAKVLLLTSVQEALQQLPMDPKIAYRCIVILGTLVWADANASELARDLDLLEAVHAAAHDPACKGDVQTQQAAEELAHALKKK